jgi:hypothetical protein
MRILLWHVHGSWATSFVQGPHDYVVPVLPDRGPDGLGRAQSWDWPASVRELPPEELADSAPDVVLLQRPHEAELLRRWTGLRVGVDVPAVYVEHNTPEGDGSGVRHPMADQAMVPVVHVTHFNALTWDCGSARTSVIEHGIVDPGPLYTGELSRAAVVVNDPIRRWRTVGTDLLPVFARRVPLDVFGMRVAGLPEHLGVDPGFDPGSLRAYEDLPQGRMHGALARRRVYLHTTRWTSLGLALLEAMHLGMPVVVLGTTEAFRAVPPGAGTVSADLDELATSLRELLHDPALARATGAAGRRAVLARYSLGRFLDDWDELLVKVT